MAVTKDKTSLAAAKARKQKIIVAVGGALLLAVVAIQGPKLWKQINPPTATPASTASASMSSGSTAATVPTMLARSKSTAVLAGVAISSDTRARRAEIGKLVAFTFFKAKDPFVPQVTTTETAGTPPPSSSSSAPASGSQATGTTSSATGEPASGSASTATTPPEKPTFATLELNGKAVRVQLKRAFPAANPTFVLVGLTDTGARIGVAGGTIAGGKALPVKLNKQVTLVDSATKTRYTLKLVYAGAAPEKVETFTSAQRASAAQSNAP
jgi:hypothetical protein